MLLETSRDQRILLFVSFFFSLSTKVQESVTVLAVGKKKTEFIKKIKSRKFKEAKSLWVARGLIKGMVLGALGKCILLIKNN